MPQPKNKAARIIVPIIALGLMVLVGWAFYQNSTASPKQGNAPAPAPATPQSPPSAATAPATPGASDSSATKTVDSKAPESKTSEPAAPQTSSAAPTQPPAAAVSAVNTTYRALVFADDPLAAMFNSMGTLERSADDRTRALVEFSRLGAGIKSLRLAEYFDSIKLQEHVSLQSEPQQATTITPFAALSIEVNGQQVRMLDPGVWRQIAPDKPGQFEAFVVDADSNKILRLDRRFEKLPNSFEIRVTQGVSNLSAAPVKVRWYQMGPIDLPKDKLAYVGDRRRLRFGYLYDKSRDPSQQTVLSGDFHIEHQTLLGKRAPNGVFPAELQQWPNPKSEKEGYQLSWTGVTNRYFGVAVMPDFQSRQGEGKNFAWVRGVNRVVLDLGLDSGGQEKSIAGLRLDGNEAILNPAGTAGSSQELSHTIFAGPMDRDVIASTSPAKDLGLSGLVFLNMGGPCGFCTFGWLTSSLLWLLQTLHNYLTFDWALAVILLVVVVRTILHPVTKFTQIRMTRFGKKMQAIGPKMKVLQEKFANDKPRLQKEIAQLYREEDVHPAQALGCLPMFLQMPVWFALYATLFFAVELRHQGAFYGVFQKIQSQGSPFWWFLGDLAEPDRLLNLGSGFRVPLISGMIGTITSLNILPLALGIVFFIQQKYLSPPTTSTLTPEQEMQQKMVKWMTVVMFPLFMYNAPAGLTLYFTTNSILSILENRYIRRHIDELDKRNPPGAKGGKGSGKPSFMQRVMQAADQRRKMLEEAQAKAQKQARRQR